MQPEIHAYQLTTYNILSLQNTLINSMNSRDYAFGFQSFNR